MIEEHIKETIGELDLSIRIRMESGFCYLRYDRPLQESIRRMLVELGYELVETTAGVFNSPSTIILWGKPRESVGDA